MTIQVLQPAGWLRPQGYSNGMVAEGRQVFVAGQVGWDEQQQFPCRPRSSSGPGFARRVT